LCPFCSAFVVNDLSRVFRDGISSIDELWLVPFGNGRVSADRTVTCQVSSMPDTVSFSLFLELGMSVCAFLKKSNCKFERFGLLYWKLKQTD
jgi:hypothetical protein